MKIRHSFVSYLVPVGLLFACIAAVFFKGSSSGNGQNLIIGIIAIAAIILFVCFRIYADYLSFDKNTVSGSTGIIRKQSMSIPLSNVTSCKLESISGLTNSICIQSPSGTFYFKNMENAKEFVNALNNEIGSIQRNMDTINAIKEGFASIKK